ncbi:CPCC family cysteine-rich protein [Glycomyces arizonensis]|uniref:CPCC family cysteine-rich protein n=1 Tax=Glycomyces arizonensis TaxID=256035 RepID=UPI0004177633|nr:CPCC family cysteine-rich protein [Glycomyces arizonensis]
MVTEQRFPCPCCGHLVHESAGSSMICPICRWEDDVTQLRWPDYQGGANRTNLLEAQRNFQRFGASDRDAASRARPPREDEPLDAGFRIADPAVDDFESLDDEPGNWPTDRSVLYWWRPDYWRRH